MYISILSNIINVVGNIIGVFGLKAGVAGVAYPSLIARAFSAVVITFLCFRQGAELRYRNKWIFTWNSGMLKKILNIAVPNGVENGLFQLVKVAMSSAFIPVIGQCMGANETDEAEYYFKKLMKITVIASVAWNVIILAATPLVMMVYDLSAETKSLIIWLVVIHNAFNALAYPFAGPLSAGLRAAGDAKFTMVVTVISTIGIRLLLSVLLGIVLNMGVIGIAFAMCADWLFKAVLFEIRFRKGIWKQLKVI